MAREVGKYDVIVLGLGAMGAATAYQLALTGKKVLGIDRFSPPHQFGSSHGDTRITRLGLGEGDKFVPLVQRSHELWRELRKKSGKRLLFEVGGLIIGNLSSSAVHHGTSNFLSNTIQVAERFGISHEVLDSKQLKIRFPQFSVSDAESAYFEPSAGYLKPEDCIRVQLELAKDLGAKLLLDTEVTEIIQSSSDTITLATPKGHFAAERLVIAAGPWIESLVPEVCGYFKVTRQIQFWFAPRESIAPFEPGRFPIFFWSFGKSDGEGMYGFPAIDGAAGGVKLAGEQLQITCLPDAPRTAVSKDEIDEAYTRYVKDRFPMLSDRCVRTACCMYTSTPSANFVIEAHPKNSRILILSACSGHGFKHSAAIGEGVAQLIAHGKSEIDLSTFKID